MHMLKITVRLIATAILNDPFFHAIFVLKLPNAYNLNSLGGRMVFLDTAVLVHIICE